MSSQYKCPECERTLDHFYVKGTYSEYGNCSGTRSLSDEYDSWDNQDCDDSQYDNEEYECPECNHEFDFEFIENAKSSNQEVYNEDAEEPPEPISDTPETPIMAGSSAEELRRAWELMHNVAIRTSGEVRDYVQSGEIRSYVQMSNGNVLRGIAPTQVIVDECVGTEAELNGSLNTESARSFVRGLDRTDNQAVICKHCGMVLEENDAPRCYNEQTNKVTVICTKCENTINLDCNDDEEDEEEEENNNNEDFNY